MAWLDNFRQGSFRGVPFKTDSSQVVGGRRKQDREFANRDEGNSEDLGKKLKTFSLELLVIGDDYFTQRDALEEALDTEGPGELVHPYRGTLQVQAGSYTLVETVQEGRLARFTVEFTLAGKLKYPEQVTDDVENAKDNAGKVIDDSKTFFETVFDIANQPAFVLDSAADKIGAVTDFAESAVAKVTAPVTNFAFAMRNIKTSVADLIKAPGELFQRLRDAFQLLLDEFSDDPETSNTIFGNLRGVGNEPAFGPVSGNTPSRQQEQINQDAVLNAVREIVLGMQAQAALDIPYTSVNDALNNRRDIVEGLDEQLFLTDDDELFQSIRDLQASLTRALPAPDQAELISYVPRRTIPVIVIAHTLFGDLEKEQEIIDQNDIEHPGFAPGGQTLQVGAS